MRQAIQTTYHGPTNTRGARITARADAGSRTVPYDHALDVEGNHRLAAVALCCRLGWPTVGWTGGGIGNGYVWVQTEE